METKNNIDVKYIREFVRKYAIEHCTGTNPMNDFKVIHHICFGGKYNTKDIFSTDLDNDVYYEVIKDYADNGYYMDVYKKSIHRVIDMSVKTGDGEKNLNNDDWVDLFYVISVAKSFVRNYINGGIVMPKIKDPFDCIIMTGYKNCNIRGLFYTELNGGEYYEVYYNHANTEYTFDVYNKSERVCIKGE